MTQAELLAEVARWPQDLRDQWEERSALVEEGCRCSREEAEASAYLMLQAKVPLREQLSLE